MKDEWDALVDLIGEDEAGLVRDNQMEDLRDYRKAIRAANEAYKTAESAPLRTWLHFEFHAGNPFSPLCGSLEEGWRCAGDERFVTCTSCRALLR